MVVATLSRGGVYVRCCQVDASHGATSSIAAAAAATKALHWATGDALLDGGAWGVRVSDLKTHILVGSTSTALCHTCPDSPLPPNFCLNRSRASSRSRSTLTRQPKVTGGAGVCYEALLWRGCRNHTATQSHSHWLCTLTEQRIPPLTRWQRRRQSDQLMQEQALARRCRCCGESL